MASVKAVVILLMGLAIGGCSSNPWVGPFKKERTESRPSLDKGGAGVAAPVVYPVKKSDLNWEGVAASVAAESLSRQKAVVAYLEQKMETQATPDVRLRLAFMLGFSVDGVRNQSKALRFYKELSEEERDQLSEEMLPALAVVMLRDLQSKLSKIWWLKKDKDKLLVEKKEREAHIKQLEEKLKAIRSIEESIHQRNR